MARANSARSSSTHRLPRFRRSARPQNRCAISLNTYAFVYVEWRNDSVRVVLSSRARLRAQVAQLVEQRTENPRVGGSIPSLGTIHFALVAFTAFTPYSRRRSK